MHHKGQLRLELTIVLWHDLSHQSRELLRYVRTNVVEKKKDKEGVCVYADTHIYLHVRVCAHASSCSSTIHLITAILLGVSEMFLWLDQFP